APKVPAEQRTGEPFQSGEEPACDRRLLCLRKLERASRGDDRGDDVQAQERPDAVALGEESKADDGQHEPEGSPEAQAPVRAFAPREMRQSGGPKMPPRGRTAAMRPIMLPDSPMRAKWRLMKGWKIPIPMKEKK